MPIGSLAGNGGGMPGGAVRPDDEWLPRALLLDPAALDPGAACWADARALGLARLPILFGWRRGGGALVAGTSQRVAGPEVLAATLALAEATSDWPAARWDEAFRSFWAGPGRQLRPALAERLPLPEVESWSLAAWSEATWGTYAEGGAASVALVAPSFHAEAITALAWLGRRTGAAAGFTAERLDEGAGRVRCTLVVGSLGSTAARPLPGEIRESPQPGSPADLLESVERLALEAGATVTWSRRDWVSFRGPAGSVRVFPRGDEVWIQLVGADEGTLAGLRFRHGVPLDRPGTDKAPPGAHLLLERDAVVSQNVGAVIREWLRGVG